MYSHQLKDGVVSLVVNDTLLPKNSAKINEAIFINIETYQARIVEKLYEIDEEKQYYLSEMVGLYNVKSPKEKLKTILNAATKVNRIYASDKTTADKDVSKAMHEEVSTYNELNLNKFSKEFFGSDTQAKREFDNILINEEVELDDAFIVSEKLAKKLEKQTFKTSSGIEVKIPSDIYSDNSEVEITNNADGTISILIKNARA